MSQSVSEHEGQLVNGNGSWSAPPVDQQTDNPFQTDGELSRKADYIVRHSRISRTEIQIADPDTTPVDEDGGKVTTAEVGHDAVDECNTVLTTLDETTADATSPDASATTTVVTTEKHEVTETSVHPTVEVSVTKGVEASPEPSSAETVKIKSKKCVVM